MVVTEKLTKMELDEHTARPVWWKRGLLISLNLKEIKYSFEGWVRKLARTDWWTLSRQGVVGKRLRTYRCWRMEKPWSPWPMKSKVRTFQLNLESKQEFLYRTSLICSRVIRDESSRRLSFNFLVLSNELTFKLCEINFSSIKIVVCLISTWRIKTPYFRCLTILRHFDFFLQIIKIIQIKVINLFGNCTCNSMRVVPFWKTSKVEITQDTICWGCDLFSLDFTKIKTKCEVRGLDGAKVTIEQVPVCKSILVTGFADVTHDFIELYFESRRNDGGPVKKVHYVPKSGRAVVVFQDTEGLWFIEL